MKQYLRPNRTAAFTILELLVVISIIVIIAALLLPALARTQAKANRISCLNNLKQIGAASHLFANDHGDRFAVGVSTNQGGSLEHNRSVANVAGMFIYSFRNFQVMSNELGTPIILICRSDKRPVATNFATLRDENVSYFTGLHADPGKPNSVLAGDWNLTNGVTRPATSTVVTEFNFTWTKQVHEERGNFLFADGRVELLKSFSLSKSAGSSSGPRQPTVTPGGSSTASQANENSRPKTNEHPKISQPAPTVLRKSGDGGVVRSVESIAAPKIEPVSTNAPLVTVADETRTESWDTEGFRFAVAVAEAGYFLLLLIAILLLLMYFLKKRRQQNQGQD
jgi:prepilin-type processing-associated H-X9-DG protein